jgi:hypothetical protein
MSKQNRTQLILGILLILLGVWFFAAQQVPSLRAWANLKFDWPLYVFGAGALIFAAGLLTGEPRMAIPASLVAGVGGILYYQSQTHDWASWTFLWTLVIGFVGIGNIITALLGEETQRNLSRGVNLLVVSAVLFLIFAVIFQRLNILGPYGPAILLILLGAYIIGRGLFRPRPPDGASQ